MLIIWTVIFEIMIMGTTYEILTWKWVITCIFCILDCHFYWKSAEQNDIEIVWRSNQADVNFDLDRAISANKITYPDYGRCFQEIILSDNRLSEILWNYWSAWIISIFTKSQKNKYILLKWFSSCPHFSLHV